MLAGVCILCVGNAQINQSKLLAPECFITTEGLLGTKHSVVNHLCNVNLLINSHLKNKQKIISKELGP